MSTIAVFGAARGIGRSFALSAAKNEKDTHIHLFDVFDSISGVKDEIESSGARCTTHIFDVCDVPAMKACFEEAFQESGVDEVCYFIRSRNATDIEELTAEEWNQEFDVTVRGAFFVVRDLIPHLQKGEGGSVVFVSSASAKLIVNAPKPLTVSYHASKAALENLTKYLAVRLGDKSIRVNAVRLGFIVQEEHTERFYSDDNTNYRARAEQLHPLSRIGHVSDVISAMRFLLSAEAGFITGHILNVDGGLSLTEQCSVAFGRADDR